MKQLSSFARLPAAERWLLLQAGFLVIMVRLGLWLLPFQNLRRLLANVRQKATAKPQAADQALISKVVWAVKVTSSYVPAATCLTQALVTQIMLARRGYLTDLQIGVARNEEGKFEAHAWVESQGRVVIGGLRDLGRFTPLEGEKLWPEKL